MEIIEAIKTRTSVRNYRTTPIPDSLVKEIIEAAIQAPSAGNTQDWEFLVVKNAKTKQELAGAAFNQEFVAKAPLIIVVCSNLDRISDAYGSRGVSLYSIQDTSAAIENLLLAAWSRGLGSCWIGAFNEEKAKDALILPTKVRPLAIITLGYPLSIPTKPRRRDLKDVIHLEKW